MMLSCAFRNVTDRPAVILAFDPNSLTDCQEKCFDSEINIVSNKDNIKTCDIFINFEKTPTIQEQM